MPYEDMKYPSEFTFACAPVKNADGTVVMGDYVKWAEWYCTSCGHVQAPAHALRAGYLNQLKNAWNQSGPCPECGAENAWDWRKVDQLQEHWITLAKGADDKAASAGSGAAAGGADLTHA